MDPAMSAAATLRLRPHPNGVGTNSVPTLPGWRAEAGTDQSTLSDCIVADASSEGVRVEIIWWSEAHGRCLR